MTTFAWPALLFSDQNRVRPEGILKQKSNLFTRYPLVLFFLLTYLLSWWSVPLMGGALFPYGPALAALIVLAIGQGARCHYRRRRMLRRALGRRRPAAPVVGAIHQHEKLRRGRPDAALSYSATFT